MPQSSDFLFVHSSTRVRPVSQHTVMALIPNNANVNAVYPDAFVCPRTIPQFPPTVKEELPQLLDGWPGSAFVVVEVETLSSL